MYKTLEEYTTLCKRVKAQNLEDKQKLNRYLAKTDLFYLLTVILGRTDAFRQWILDRCIEVSENPNGYLDVWSRDHYKAIDVNEPVPTPNGFKKHGDLDVGDYVFSPNGDEVKVIAKTPIYYNAPCCRVTFDCGYSVVVSSNHLWTVEILTKEGMKETLINTSDLFKEFNKCKYEQCYPQIKRCSSKVLVKQTTGYHKIINIEQVEPIPVSCIQVDSKDGLYLIGEHYIATHNSSIITFALTVQDVLKDPEITVGIFSHSAKIAKDFLLQIKREFEDNIVLQSLFPDILYENPHRDSPVWNSDRNIVKRKSNPTAWGIIIYWCLSNYLDLITIRREDVVTNI